MVLPERFLTPECIEAALGKPPRGIGIPVLKPLWLDRTIARAHPAFPLVLYGPLAVACLAWVYRPGLLAVEALMFFAGLLVFTLVEYILHRFIFHRDFAETREGKIDSFLTHGYHHAYPIDPTRLVMPPLISIPLGLLAFFLTHVLLSRAVGPVADAAWSGFAVGYIAYDSIHYVLHHTKRTTGAIGWMKRYHHLHHHAPEPGRFGVSTPLWDVILGTFKPVPKSAPRATRAAR